MTPLERQIAFDIAMHVGHGLDMQPMLRESLSLMMRQLGCVIGGVFRLDATPDDSATPEPLHVIPRHSTSLPAMVEARGIIDKLLPGLPREACMPLETRAEDRLHLHLYALPHFGVLALIRPGTPLSLPLRRTLISIAQQLAQACLACDRFDAISSIQTELHAEKERAQVAMRSLGDGVITASPRGHIQLINPAAERLLGLRPGEALGQRLTAILEVRDEASGKRVSTLGAEAQLPTGRRVVLSSGTRSGALLEISASHMHDQAGRCTGTVLVLRDVTEEVQAKRTLEWEANHDMLTRLANRRAFERRLDSLFRSARSEHRQHALIVLDLDHFKVLNDSEGHAAGDELLRQIALLITTQVRAPDLAARLGGDEFALLLSDCPIGRAETIGRNIAEAIAQIRFYWGGRPHPISASIGVVGIDADTINAQEALSDADTACYAAKEKGRNQVQVFRPGDEDLLSRKESMGWITRLGHALENRLFTLVAQPIHPLDASSRWSEHYEILLRMTERGQVISPAQFIVAAERYHFMPRIDRWVIEETLDCMSRSSNRINVGINLSGQSLGDEKFPGFLRDALRESRIEPARLYFEITETAAIANLTRARDFIDEFRALGYRFALDDFGSGLSSFAYLKNLGVDMLKIDGAFVRNVDRDATDRVMVEAIARVGKVMGIPTIAEYVERDSIIDTLRDIGVDCVQGWAIGQPRALRDVLAPLH